VTAYKHQWNVVEAIATLRQQGYPVVLDLVGPVTMKAGWRRLRDAMKHVDPAGTFIFYHGSVAHASLARYYQDADLFIFASSCENMPNILLEAMVSGLPIACSERGPMPELLGEAGSYFDPDDPRQIVQAIRDLIDDREKRVASAEGARERAGLFTWSCCAQNTFRFLAQVAGCN
jgi:glycosyltransferase involved in cell wall biosynthesis